MWYLYILKSNKNGRRYVGSISDLKQRIKDHNSGRGGSYSKNNFPFELVYYEAYKDKKDAIAAEKFYKSGYGREILSEKIKHSFQK